MDNPRYYPVSVEIEGKKYIGAYSLDRGEIHVKAPSGSKSAQVGNSPVERLARAMLTELVLESEGPVAPGGLAEQKERS
jgi:hypothetical protein